MAGKVKTWVQEWQYMVHSFSYTVLQKNVPCITSSLDMKQEHWRPSLSIKLAAHYHHKCSYMLPIAHVYLVHILLGRSSKFNWITILFSSLTCHTYSYRLCIYLPSGWPFIVICIVLRIIEGVATALFTTAGYTLLTELYPESTGFIVVCVQN